ncbi:TetR/AcrR family transcriptional regulator [filamentous cyanobacterium LEGE 07170]|nr:TetR/AcrR family transcriptional regulator [filamentous cyanobacterium LEGE 07170]
METKQQLMTATLKLVARQGYENVSIDDIAAATDNTKGAVYHYFRSKHDLYKAALGCLAEQLSTMSLVDLDETGDVKDFLKETLWNSLDVSAQPNIINGLSISDLYYLFFDGIRRFPDIKPRLQALNRQYMSNVIEHVKHQSAAGDESTTVALQFLVWIEGLNLIQAMTGGLITKDDVSAMVDRFFD